jgi:hypothetical protein
MGGFSRWPGSDLDAAQRRRLWIVEQVLEGGAHRSPADAFELALRLERFISRGLDHCERDRHEHEPDASRSSDGSGLLSSPAPAAAMQAPAACAPPQPAGNGARSVHPNGHQQVANAPASGEAGRSLAAGLPHSLGAGQAGKLHLARRPQRRSGRANSSHRHLSSDEELALQQQFLRQRAPAPSTIEDVIRYLRQRGDSVVTHDGGYLVNERLVLTKDQLIARANRQRKHMGAPLFAIANEAAATPEKVPQGLMMSG